MLTGVRLVNVHMSPLDPQKKAIDNIRRVLQGATFASMQFLAERYITVAPLGFKDATVTGGSTQLALERAYEWLDSTEARTATGPLYEFREALKKLLGAHELIFS
jgi:hypothetical protein